MARNIPELEYERVWTNRQDFKTYEDSEDEVRADLQYHPNVIKDYINQWLLPNLNTIDAADLSFESSEAVPATTVQDAIENVQEQLVGITQDGVANQSITAEKLVPNTLNSWVEVTSQITLTYNGSTHDSNIVSKSISNKNFWYNASLGIVRFSMTLNLRTTDLAYFITFRQSGNYLPKIIGANGCALAVSSMGEGPAEVDAGLIMSAISASETVPDYVFSVNSAFNKSVQVSGWYICDGVGDEEEASS